MLDTAIVIFLENLIILNFLFWVLSVLGRKFFWQKKHVHETEFYECGFFPVHKDLLGLNMSVFFLGGLSIIYDVEFLFLVPFLFNHTL